MEEKESKKKKIMNIEKVGTKVSFKQERNGKLKRRRRTLFETDVTSLNKQEKKKMTPHKIKHNIYIYVIG